MVPENLCIIPFISISTHPGGFISRCMMSSLPMASIEDLNGWDNENFVNLRKDMLSGTWNLPGCETCHGREKQGLVSQRINWKTNERWWNADLWDNRSFVTVENKIYHLFLNSNNLCNFKCRMCNSLYSNSWINDEKLLNQNGFSRTINNTFLKNKNNLKLFVENMLPKLTDLRMITITGGEPFINDEILESLELLDQADILKNLHLSITTNGSLLDVKKLQRISNAKKININISIDGTGKLFEYMRSGSSCSWEKINSIIEEMEYLRNYSTNYILSFNSSYQIYNMLNVKEFYDWAENIIKRPHEWIEYRLLTHPEYLHVGIAPNEIKNKAADQLDYVEKKYSDKNKFFIENMRRNLLLDNHTSQWQQFKKFTTILDKKRNQSIESVCPELYAFF